MKLDPETEARCRALAGLPPVDHAMPEADFQRRVLALAKRGGWLRAHFRAVRVADRNGKTHWQTPVDADGAGFPDVVLARDRLLFVELKTERGPLRPDQAVWRARIEAAGGEYRLWRPSDLPAITEELK